MVHILLKPGLENFEHCFTSMWDECNCAVVWAFFGIAFLWNWNENRSFPVLWPLLSFPNLLAYWMQHFHSNIFQDLKQDKLVTTANSQASCISNFSLVKEDRNPPSTSFPELLWEGYSGVARAMLVAVMLRLPIYWALYIHHFAYPQDMRTGEIPSVKKTRWKISWRNMLTDHPRFLLVAQI